MLIISIIIFNFKFQIRTLTNINKQLKERFAVKNIKLLIPLSSNNSFNNVSHQFYYLKRQLNEQKCLLDIQTSIRTLDKQESPLDIQKYLYSSIRPKISIFVQYPVDIQMSIRLLDKQKCTLDIQMSIRPMDEWTQSDGKHSSLLFTCGHSN